jgi:hypothetical protein
VPLTTIKTLVMQAEGDGGGGVGKYRLRARVLSVSPHPAATQAVLPSAAAAAAEASEESKEGELAAAASVHAVQPLQPLESICKVYCSLCSVWSACSSDVSVGDRCASCNGVQSLSYGYFLSLLLHDSTGALPVLLCGSEAEDLFVGLPAANLWSSTTTAKFVRQRLARLLAPGTFIDAHVHAYDVHESVGRTQPCTSKWSRCG